MGQCRFTKYVLPDLNLQYVFLLLSSMVPSAIRLLSPDHEVSHSLYIRGRRRGQNRIYSNYGLLTEIYQRDSDIRRRARPRPFESSCSLAFHRRHADHWVLAFYCIVIGATYVSDNNEV